MFQRQRVSGLAGNDDPLHRESGLAGSVNQCLHALRVFHENGFGIAPAQIADLVRQRISGVERRGDGPVRHDAQIHQAELGACFRINRNHVALADANPAQAAGNFLNRRLILDPTVRLVFALAERLVQRRRASVVLSGRFQDRVYGARTHVDITNMNHERLVKGAGGCGPRLKSGGRTRIALSARYLGRNQVRQITGYCSGPGMREVDRAHIDRGLSGGRPVR